MYENTCETFVNPLNMICIFIYISFYLYIYVATNAVYQSRKSVLVREAFVYINRDIENKKVVELFQQRQKDRARGPVDKIANPLIVIPASPGSGKSTFLMHFPECEEYAEYCSDKSAIIAPLTFNSQMNTFYRIEKDRKPVVSHTFGLRILYGAAVAMGGIENSWGDFLAQFSRFANLQADDAISVLRRVYGEDRRVLILVDELSKSKRYHLDDSVMDEIDVILDNEGDADVLVSSLSPQYMEDLVRHSRRPIRHVVLNSLVDSKLVQSECIEWANKLIANRTVTKPLDDFSSRGVQSVYLLLSGHPRSLEMLVGKFKEENSKYKYWPRLASIIETRNDTSVVDVIDAFNFGLFSTRDPIFSKQAKTNVAAINDHLNLVLRRYDNNLQFRKLVESGEVFVLPASKYSGDYRVTITLASFLNMIELLSTAKTDTISDATRAAVELFKGLVSENAVTSIGTLFERAVGLTIAAGSLNLGMSQRPGIIFGCASSEILNFTVPELSVRIASDKASMIMPTNIAEIKDELIIAPPNQAGSEGRAVFAPKNTSRNNSTITIYFEVKVSIFKGDALTMRVKKLDGTLSSHYDLTVNWTMEQQIESFQNLYMMFYEWVDYSKASEGDYNAMFIEALTVKIGETLNTIKGTTDFDRKSACFHAFLDTIKVNERVFVIGRAALKEWLLPVMLPIPLIVEKVQNGNH